MSPREANVLWLKDILEHLAACQKRLEWAHDSEAIGVICETMIRDLDRCQKLCETIRNRAAVRYTA